MTKEEIEILKELYWKCYLSGHIDWSNSLVDIIHKYETD